MLARLLVLLGSQIRPWPARSALQALSLELQGENLEGLASPLSWRID